MYVEYNQRQKLAQERKIQKTFFKGSFSGLDFEYGVISVNR